MSQAITYTRREGMAEIVLDDGKVNAMAAAFFLELNAALDRVEGDDNRALVVVGRPGCLSAGLNVKLLPTLPPDDLVRTLLAFGRTLLRVWTLPLPTVAAVTGHAIAGGALLAFACDRRFIADGPFRIHMNETAIGLTLPSFAIAICQSVMPAHCQNEALLHAKPYTPAEALACGMVDDVVSAERVIARAREAARALTALDRTAYAASKQRLRSRAAAWAEQHLEAEMRGLPLRTDS